MLHEVEACGKFNPILNCCNSLKARIMESRENNRICAEREKNAIWKYFFDIKVTTQTELMPLGEKIERNMCKSKLQ